MPIAASKPAGTRSRARAKSVPNVIRESDPGPDTEARLEHIATAAYYKAMARGFMPGQDMDDWLEAEAEFDERAEQ
jgi:Protein of unknown function (DUF2934)